LTKHLKLFSLIDLRSSYFVVFDAVHEDLFAGVTYLDHAGATLYTEQQVTCTLRDLSDNVYGNPHSRSECSQRTTELIELVRSRCCLACFVTNCFQFCQYFSAMMLKV